MSKEEEISQGNNHTHADGPQSKVIYHIEKNDSCNETLEPLCKALDHAKLRCLMLLRDLE